MDIAIPIFDRITALDAIGPYEVLSRLPGARIRWVAIEPGQYRTDNRMLTMIAEEPLSAVPHPEIIMVPGGFGTRSLLTPNPLLDWLRAAHETSQWTTSVCTGSLLLGAAGLLRGRRAACHWAYRELLPLFGAEPDAARVVRDGNLITGGGVTAGIDLGLTVLAELAGRDLAESVQLALEYAPEPPFASGRPELARAAVRTRVLERIEAFAPQRLAIAERVAQTLREA